MANSADPDQIALFAYAILSETLVYEVLGCLLCIIFFPFCMPLNCLDAEDVFPENKASCFIWKGPLPVGEGEVDGLYSALQ